MICSLPFSEEPDRVRTLLEDVENVRRAKMYEGMGTAAQEVQQAVKVVPRLCFARIVGCVLCCFEHLQKPFGIFIY